MSTFSELDSNLMDREIVNKFRYSDDKGMAHMAERLEAALDREATLIEHTKGMGLELD